jgi:L-amino acid N-acyltransferase YncA
MLIRPAASADAPALVEIYRPLVERTTISFELEAPTAAQMRSRIARIRARYPWLVAVDRALVVGYAYASAHRERPAYAGSVDVSIYVGEADRGNGVGRALYGALFAELERNGTFHRAFAGIALPNEPSIGLHEKFGFELVGIYREAGKKFGRWIDVSWWQRGITPSAGRRARE